MIISSILNDDKAAKDFFTPYTFVDWLKQNTAVNPDVNEQFVNYKSYIIEWSNKKSLTKDDFSKTLQSLYIQVLREITLTYSTEEERRFITNVDLTDPSDVEIILPFFINKLKKLCLYYSIVRENLKNTPIEYGHLS